MSFVNEELTKEERNTLINRKIYYGMGRILKSSYRTIDRERNLLLMKCGVYGFDVPEDIVFYFEIKESEFLIKITEHSGMTDENSFVISYSNFEIIKSFADDYDSIILKQYLKEALQVFELTGDPAFKINKIVKYIFDF
ncbi:MAG: hypothetical protein IJ642_11605 [Oscillospiraceae bacterium]|nr:hypothetical protein [Oscillospiraceae bacterium]